MPFTPEQETFVTTHMKSMSAKLLEMRKERLAELDGIKPVKRDTAKLEAMLKSTGRADDPTGAKKKAHLEDILLRDEDGMNANLIATNYSKVTDADRVNARKELNDATPAPERIAIEAAREALAKERAHQEFIETEIQAAILAALPADYDTKTADEQAAAMRNAKNVALEKVADEEYQRERLADPHARKIKLAHHASRHGPQTEKADHVTRIATAYPPDQKDAAPISTLTLTTDTGETFQIPVSSAKGPEKANAASWMGSAEVGLRLIEDALSKAHEALRLGQVDVGKRVATDSGGTATDEITGGSVGYERMGGSPTGQPVEPGTNTPLPGVNSLASAATDGDREAIVRKRVESAQIDEEIRGFKVVTEATPDGGFRSVTAFPDSRVSGPAFTKRVGGANVNIDLDQAASDKRDAAIVTAQQAQVQSGQARDTKQLEYDAASQEFSDAITEIRDATQAAPDAATELSALQKAAGPWAKANGALTALTAELNKATQQQAAIARQLLDVDANLAGPAGLEQAFKDADAAFKLSRDAATTEALRLARDKLEEAKQLKARSTEIKTTVDDLVKNLQAEKLKAEREVTGYKTAMDTAFDAARDKSNEPTAQRVVTAVVTANQKIADVLSKKGELDKLKAQASFAASEAARLQREKDDAAAPRTPPTDTEVETERMARRDALKDALARSPEDFAAEQKKWQDEIDTVAQVYADEKAFRTFELDRVTEELRVLEADVDLLDRELISAKATVQLLTEEGAADDRLAKDAAKKIKALTPEHKQKSDRLALIKGIKVETAARNEAQDALDAANVALAKARMQRTFVDAEVVAGATGAKITELQKLELSEALAMYQARDVHLKSELKDTKRRFDASKTLVAKHEERQGQSLADTKEMIRIVLQTTGTLDDSLKNIQDNVIPIFQRDVDAQKAHGDEVTKLEAQIVTNKEELTDAEKALAKL